MNRFLESHNITNGIGWRIGVELIMVYIGRRAGRTPRVALRVGDWDGLPVIGIARVVGARTVRLGCVVPRCGHAQMVVVGRESESNCNPSSRTRDVRNERGILVRVLLILEAVFPRHDRSHPYPASQTAANSSTCLSTTIFVRLLQSRLLRHGSAKGSFASSLCSHSNGPRSDDH